jgi:4'-phosphopantetheinyl transferase superfamily protein
VLSLEPLLENELGNALGVSVKVSMAYAPVDPSSLSAGEEARRQALEGSPKLGAWMRGRRALKRLLGRFGEAGDTASIAFPNPRFSLTHSGDTAVAVGTALPSLRGIGVDLELGRGPGAAAERLFLGENERRVVAALGPRARLRLWTVKEALYKANLRNSETWFTHYFIDDPQRDEGSAFVAREGGRLEMRYASFELTGGYLTVAVCP